MILHYEGISAINNITYQQYYTYEGIRYHKILQYEGGLSAINNIKYHDITLWRAISNKQHKIS